MTVTTPILDITRLQRARLGARAILALGIGASLAANVQAAEPSGAGRIIAAWSPIALLLTVELISRVPVAGGWLSVVRIAATATIASIAAWVSYWHMVEVALAHGEAPVAAHLLPISVDGLVVVASVCMTEISKRLQAPSSDTGASAEDLGIGTDTGKPSTSIVDPSDVEVERPALAPAPKRTRATAGAGSVRDQVRRVASEHPDWSQAQIANEIGCSDRTVRRHLAASTNDDTTDAHQGEVAA